MNIISEIVSAVLASIAITFIIALIYSTSFSPQIFKAGTVIAIIALGMFSWGFWKTRGDK